MGIVTRSTVAPDRLAFRTFNYLEGIAISHAGIIRGQLPGSVIRILACQEPNDIVLLSDSPSLQDIGRYWRGLKRETADTPINSYAIANWAIDKERSF